jgi:hypothetical protein
MSGRSLPRASASVHGPTCMHRRQHNTSAHASIPLALRDPADRIHHDLNYHTSRTNLSHKLLDTREHTMAPTLYPRGTVKKIVKAHSNRPLSKNVDILVG